MCACQRGCVCATLNCMCSKHSAHKNTQTYKTHSTLCVWHESHSPHCTVMLGGGRRYFDSRRADARDLLAEHADRYTIVKNARELRALNSQGARGGEVEVLKRQSSYVIDSMN